MGQKNLTSLEDFFNFARSIFMFVSSPPPFQNCPPFGTRVVLALRHRERYLQRDHTSWFHERCIVVPFALIFQCGEMQFLGKCALCSKLLFWKLHFISVQLNFFGRREEFLWKKRKISLTNSSNSLELGSCLQMKDSTQRNETITVWAHDS